MTSVAVLDVLGGEAQVVEARLGCDVDSVLPRLLQDWDALGRRKVHDVQVQLWRQVGQRQDLLYRARLKNRRPRVEKCVVGGQLASGGQWWL